jgi:geranylgeranyl pyrophosphate synthase
MVLAMSYALNENETDLDSFNMATPSQKRLAEITEMIHTASLFHDDVIDKVK